MSELQTQTIEEPIEEIDESEINDVKLDKTSLYFQAISKYKLLSKDETYYYIALAQNGDKQAFDKIVLHNLKLVVYVIRKYYLSNYKGSLTIDDLISEGFFGLHRAIEKFNLEYGFGFSTYAVWWIKQSIRLAIKKSNLVHVPIYAQTKGVKIHQLNVDFDLLQRQIRCNEVGVWRSGDKEFSLLNIEIPYDSIEVDRLKDKIKIFMKDLPIRKQQILDYSLGINTDILTLEEISKSLEPKITRERVRQIKNQLLKKLKIFLKFDIEVDLVN